jgi:2-polyprenyl-3-methyl-5-hydroxy-6-metoxy-1,4-benzoquinol methylase
MSTSEHWEQVYSTKSPDEVSWFQREPIVSLQLIDQYATKGDSIIDVGAGQSHLVDQLFAEGYLDLTILDISEKAMEGVKERLGSLAVQSVIADIRAWKPERLFDVWHDRAVFHFMNSTEDVSAYIGALKKSVANNGIAVIGTFAEDGPTQCSGLDVRRYSPAELGEVFAEDFSLLETNQEEHITPWGVIQKFSWVVLQRT